MCLERGDKPVRFAYRTTSEGFMVAEKWEKPSVHQILEIWLIEVCLPVFVVFIDTIAKKEDSSS